MRLAIYDQKGPIFDQVMSYAKRHNVSVQPIKHITAHTIQSFQGIIFTSDNPLPNLTKVLEQLVLRQVILIIYIHQGKAISTLYNIEQDPYFIDLIHYQIDMMFNQKVTLALKYIKIINQCKTEFQIMKTNYDQLKEELKAKRILMKKGMKEHEAHRFIQSKAMQLRKQKFEIVNLIIENKIDL